MHFGEVGSQAAAVSRDGIQETDLRAFWFARNFSINRTKSGGPNPSTCVAKLDNTLMFHAAICRHESCQQETWLRRVSTTVRQVLTEFSEFFHLNSLVC